MNSKIVRLCDASREVCRTKALYNRCKRRGEKGVFARMIKRLAAEAAVPKRTMIDATYLQAQ